MKALGRIIRGTSWPAAGVWLLTLASLCAPGTIAAPPRAAAYPQVETSATAAASAKKETATAAASPQVETSATAAAAREDTLYLSLGQAVRLALQHNEDVKIAESELDKAHGRKKEAYSAALPSITGQAGYTRNILRPVIFFPNPDNSDEVLKIEIGEKNDFLMSAYFQQPLYAFGRIGGAVRIADYYLKSSEKDLTTARQQAVLETKEAYYRVLLADAALDISRQALDQTRRHLDETIVKLDQRVAARFDSIRAAVAVRNAEPAVIESGNALVLSMLDLKRIVGIDGATPVRLTDRLEFAAGTYDLQGAIDKALSNRPDVAAMRLRVAMTEKIVSVTKRNNFPFLSAVGTYTLQGQESDSFFPPRDKFAQSFGVGLTLSVPLFDGFSTRGKVQQAKADLSIMQYSLQKIEKVVELQVTQLYNELTADMDNLRGGEATVAMAEEAYRLGLVRYQNGLSTSLELSDTEFALTSARLNHLRAVYNCIITAERLENAMGD